MHKNSLLIAGALATLASCFDSSSPSEKKAREEKTGKKAAEPVSGQNAYYKMYGAAKGWSTDLQGYRCEPVRLAALAEKDGRFPAWKCTFVSESRRAMKTYSYSVVEAEGLFKDVFGGHDESYSGPRGQNVPFPILALKIDSDAAIETAKGKSDSVAYMKKNPSVTMVTPILEKTKEVGNAVWRIYWGNPATSNFSVLIDASTGEYVRTMR
jgi:hypothetical protein